MSRAQRKSMDHSNFQTQVKNIYKAVKELELMFPSRHFTPDGHMVGSIGECLVADAYGLELKTASNKGFDALSKDGKQIEIKATQSGRVAFRSCPEFAIIIKIHKDGTFRECYNGPGSIIWEVFTGREMPSNGQYQISINKVKQLQKDVPVTMRIKPI